MHPTFGFGLVLTAALAVVFCPSAFAAGVPLHELAPEGTSLEEIFLQLTAEQEG